jgi:serine/threonine-protein kinase
VVLAEMLTGYNPFLGATPEESRNNICSMPLEEFDELLPKEASKLRPILHKCLERTREKRYQTAKDLMVKLEKLLYAKGYGPTNEKLALYLKDLYKDGQAYVDDMSELPVSMALNPDQDG